MLRVRVLQPDPDLEAEGLGAGTETDMPVTRASSLERRGLVVILKAAPERRVRRPAEGQAHPRAPETT